MLCGGLSVVGFYVIAPAVATAKYLGTFQQILRSIHSLVSRLRLFLLIIDSHSKKHPFFFFFFFFGRAVQNSCSLTIHIFTCKSFDFGVKGVCVRSFFVGCFLTFFVGKRKRMYNDTL